MRLVSRLAAGLCAAVLLWPGELFGQKPEPDCNIWCLSERGREALAARHYSQYLVFARQMEARAPDLPVAVYAVARGYALTGQRTAALRQLERLADLGASRDLASDSAFAPLRDDPKFRAMLVRMAENQRAIVGGVAAFAPPDPDLLPEALAHDSGSGTWLIGSLAHRKVIRMATDGSTSDFITSSELLRVVGIHIDAERSLLWFATWAPRPAGTAPGQDPGSETRLFRCDLATGRVIRTYTPADSGGSHLFNDLAIARNGDVYITDTERGWIHRVRADVDSLEVFLRPDSTRLTAANGIALAPDQRTLYVAFTEGIARIDLRTRATARLRSPARGSTAAVDGLYWYRGSLVAVQHVPGIEQVARFHLAGDRRSIRRVEVLERGDSLLRRPTTGAIVGDRFFYIATSQYDRLGPDNRLRPSSGSPAPRSTVRVIDLSLP